MKKAIFTYSLFIITLLFSGCVSSLPQDTPAAGAVTSRENPYLKQIDQSVYTPFVSDQSGPLADSIPVKVAQWGILDGYIVIGYAEVTGDTVQERIIIAERYARAFGGDVIMPKGVTTKEQITSAYRDHIAQGFLIWRKQSPNGSGTTINVLENLSRQKPAAKQDDSLLQDLSDPKAAALPDYPMYGKLPRLTFNALIGGNDSIKSQSYRGASFPLKILKLPEDLGVQTEPDSVMVMLATRSGESKLLLVAPASKSEWIQEKISSDKLIEYVYKPLGVYKEKYPVLQFVDEMK